MVAPRRCSWCTQDDAYLRYHDEEWGVSELTDQGLFERLVLESMQAGLSWLTVLKKRDAMSKRFLGFDINALAACGDDELNQWLQDPAIIRHQGKLQAVVNNARCVQKQSNFSSWLWQFAPDDPPVYDTSIGIPSSTTDSVAMSKALKRAGFRFVGPTICYALMQSVGMVNDHPTTCFRHEPCAQLRRTVKGAKG